MIATKWFMVGLAAWLLSPLATTQQDDDDRRGSARVQRLADVRGFNASSEDLRNEVRALTKLTEVDSIVDKVTDEVSLTTSQRRALTELVAEYREEWVAGGGVGGGDDFEQALEEAVGDQAEDVKAVLEEIEEQ
ncbi:MAG: hypothetical protein GTO41_13360, partial [Burkholderiales bacterium]|nr:hypothetical protein [Burkholderiales bacterium]